MTASDWIALAQALLLVAAALLALRGYSLGLIEHREAREEAAKAPLRDLIGDVIREVKELAAQAEKRVMPGGTQRLDLIAGRQRRLAVALASARPDVFNLFATRELTTCGAQDVMAQVIEKVPDDVGVFNAFWRVEPVDE